MKIAEIRETIAAATWSRTDLSGSTADEFRRCDVATRLQKHIDAIRALTIPDRFREEQSRAGQELGRLEVTIEKWHATQNDFRPEEIDRVSIVPRPPGLFGLVCFFRDRVVNDARVEIYSAIDAAESAARETFVNATVDLHPKGSRAAAKVEQIANIKDNNGCLWTISRDAEGYRLTWFEPSTLDGMPGLDHTAEHPLSCNRVSLLSQAFEWLAYCLKEDGQ